MTLCIFSDIAGPMENSTLATLKDEFSKIVRILNSNDIDFSVIGALALAEYTKPRSTSDVDILLLNDQYQETLDALEEEGFKVEVEGKGFQFRIRSTQKSQWDYDFLFATGFDPEGGAITSSKYVTIMGVPKVPIPGPEYLTWLLLQSIESQSTKSKRDLHTSDLLRLLDSGKVDRRKLFHLMDRDDAKSLRKLLTSILDDDNGIKSSSKPMTWAELQLSKK